MPLEDFIITVFCWVEEHLDSLLGDHRLRQRGFAPKLTDSEVITLEVVGEFLGWDTDVGIWKYFRRHGLSWFPELGSRTPFAQQAANLWVVKQRLHQHLVIDLGAATDPIRLVDGCPMPVCVLTRAPQCRRFPGVADVGYCAAKKQYYYGLHGHLMITFDGVITGCTVTPAAGDEREALWDLTESVQGLVIGDKGYISAFLQAELATVGIDLQTPWRANMNDPRPPKVVQPLTRTRRRVETVIGQLAEQFHFEKIRARDVWHLTSRIARKVLAHTLGVIFQSRRQRMTKVGVSGIIWNRPHHSRRPIRGSGGRGTASRGDSAGRGRLRAPRCLQRGGSARARHRSHPPAGQSWCSLLQDAAIDFEDLQRADVAFESD